MVGAAIRMMPGTIRNMLIATMPGAERAMKARTPQTISQIFIFQLGSTMRSEVLLTVTLHDCRAAGNRIWSASVDSYAAKSQEPKDGAFESLLRWELSDAAAQEGRLKCAKEEAKMGKLDGRVAVITAGTSGMALATAKRFVEEGAYVFITGRNKERLEKAVKEIGKNVTGVQADSSKLADLEKLYEAVKREKGKIDVLFASAGEGSFASVEEVTEEHFDSTFNTNVRGTLFTVQKALPLFADNGSIILNGSIAGVKGIPRFGVYSASKAAVRSFARTWLVELKDRGIRVNVLSPGTIDTPALDFFGDDGKKALTAAIPRGTMGRPEEIAGAATFLASDDASFVNGIELFVDGGTAQI